MADFIQVPIERLASETLHSLLEEYASRDGTDYGAREQTLEEKVSQLKRLLDSGQAGLVYDQASEQWDILDSEAMAELGL